MRVAIVGAGIAGLQQGRALQKRGIDFHIYEAAEKVGGVWRQTAHLQGAQGKRAQWSSSRLLTALVIKKAEQIYQHAAVIVEQLALHTSTHNTLSPVCSDIPVL